MILLFLYMKRIVIKKKCPADVSIAEDSLFFFNSSFCFIIVRTQRPVGF